MSLDSLVQIVKRVRLTEFGFGSGAEIARRVVLASLRNQIKFLAQVVNIPVNSAQSREALSVPNGTRKVFCEGGATMGGLIRLNSEATQILNAAENEIVRSGKVLAETRLHY